MKRGLLHPRQHPGLAAGAAAAEHPAAGRVRQEGRRPDPDPAGVAGPAPQRRRRAPRATPGWTRWGWPSRTSTRSGDGATRSGPSPIDASGKLITGESFKDVRELKQILVDRHRRDFYRCLTEKMLTYALGRGLEAYDVQAVDTIVERIESEDGRASALIAGIIESAPFQKRRRSTKMDTADLSDPGAGRASEPTEIGTRS